MSCTALAVRLLLPQDACCTPAPSPVQRCTRALEQGWQDGAAVCVRQRAGGGDLGPAAGLHSQHGPPAAGRWAGGSTAWDGVHLGCRLDSLCIYKRVGRGPTCCTVSSPADLEAVLRLLLLAREQAAEPVVAVCLRELHSKVRAG